MTLVEAVRRLHFTAWEDSCHWTCESCGQAVEPEDRTGRWVGHADDCPWLALPKIVAALEAATELVKDREITDYRGLCDYCGVVYGAEPHEEGCIIPLVLVIRGDVAPEVVPDESTETEHLTGTTR